MYRAGRRHEEGWVNLPMVEVGAQESYAKMTFGLTFEKRIG